MLSAMIPSRVTSNYTAGDLKKQAIKGMEESPLMASYEYLRGNPFHHSLQKGEG